MNILEKYKTFINELDNEFAFAEHDEFYLYYLTMWFDSENYYISLHNESDCECIYNQQHKISEFKNNDEKQKHSLQEFIAEINNDLDERENTIMAEIKFNRDLFKNILT